MKLHTLIFCALVSSNLLAGVGYAQTEIPCPPFIGSTENGVLYRLKTRHDRKKLRCYRAKKEARTVGFLPRGNLAKQSYDGWWRLRLAATSTTCPKGPQVGEGPAQFVQIIDNLDTAFAHFCPAEEVLSGYRDDEGVTLSTTYRLNEVPDPLFCRDGQVEVTENLKMHKIVEDGHEFGASYTFTRRCLSETDSDRSCRITFAGVAFPETHEIWPEVAPSFSQIKPQCVKALETCVSCHPGFATIPTLGK